MGGSKRFLPAVLLILALLCACAAAPAGDTAGTSPTAAETASAETAAAETAAEAAPADRVILGREGWLFFADSLAEFTGAAPMSDRELWAAARCLALVREQAGAERFLFVLVPCKNQVYPEYMPEEYDRGPGSGERLIRALEDQGVPCLDLLPVMLDHKDEALLWHRLDSHWNYLGAALAADAIGEALGQSTDHYDPARFTVRRDHTGDLEALLHPADPEPDEQAWPDRDWTFSYVRPIRSPEDQHIETRAGDASGSLVMFRDSFGNTLHCFLAEDYGSAMFSRAMPYDAIQAAQFGADTLILEITRRHLHWLCQRAPILAAPVRDPELPPAEDAGSLALTVSQASGKLWKVTGYLPEAPDFDSPVYLRLDGQLYEASPVGDPDETGSADRAFTAYLPEPRGPVEVLWRAGSWRAAAGVTP